MKHPLRRHLSLLLCVFFMGSQVKAQSSSYLGVQQFGQNRGAEFVSGNQPGTVLMRVNLWGAVQRPGIHHIPVKTDLMSLFSYAGGPLKDASLDEVTIKREVGNSRKLITVDVEELIEGVSHHHVELAPNDIIVVPEEKPFIGKNTVTVITLLSIIMSTVLAATIIERNQNR